MDWISLLYTSGRMIVPQRSDETKIMLQFILPTSLHVTMINHKKKTEKIRSCFIQLLWLRLLLHLFLWWMLNNSSSCSLADDQHTFVVLLSVCAPDLSDKQLLLLNNSLVNDSCRRHPSHRLNDDPSLLTFHSNKCLYHLFLQELGYKIDS